MKSKNKIKNPEFVRQANGVEVLKSKESRQKQRRWTFIAEVTVPGAEIAQRLDTTTVCFGNSATAHLDAEEIKQQLLGLKHLENATVQVIPVPHETVSLKTIAQIEGNHQMAMVLDYALELCFDDLKLSSVSDTYKDMDKVAGKEYFYQRALDKLRESQAKAHPELVPQVAPAIQLTDEIEHKEFVPEIINPESRIEDGDVVESSV